MQNLIQTIKFIKIRQVLTVFLAGCLLIISTACSQGNIAQSGGKAYTETAKRAMSDTYNDYDANQDFKGGMNGYNDDRRYDAETAAKTKALVDNDARVRNRQQEADLGDYAEEITDRAEKVSKDASRTLQANQEKAVNYIQDKSENLKNNLSEVPGEAKKVFDEATDTAQNAIIDADRASKRTAKEIKDNFEDLT